LFVTDLLAGLNPQQHTAITAPDGPVMVLAGPGSGKTRVLSHRVAWLIRERDIVPHRIMAVTFTNKAAREMRSRIEGLLGGRLRGLSIGTFHAICAQILRREADFITSLRQDYVIYDTSDQLSLVKQSLGDLNMDDKRFPATRMLNLISRAKNELIEPQYYRAESYFAEAAGRVYERYMELLEANNAADFDDLLMRVALLLGENEEVRERYQGRYDHVLVDEFQDTNMAQYVLLRHLADGHKNIFCVGDPDQSIYTWRGADYRNIQRFDEDFAAARTILLEQNYRSTQIILDAAMAVIDKNPGRTPKKLFTDRESGSKPILYEAYDEADEARFVVDTIATLTATGEAEPGGCAVMYRTNAQSRILEDAFMRAGLPYKLVGATRFYARREIKDMLAFLRVIYNPEDSVSLMRIINVPTRGIGQKTLGNLKIWADTRGSSVWNALEALTRDATASPFKGRAYNALRKFALMVTGWREVAGDLSVLDLLNLVIDETGFHDALDDGTDEGHDRWENVVELRNVAAGYEGLPMSTFLEEVALVSEVDDLPEEANAPTLLTLHAAKGLEFPVVLVVGLEDGLLPHQRSFDEPEGIAEERRLFYVGMTRAEDRLYLVYAFRRTVWGDNSISMPSRFLDDIPSELLAGNVPLHTGGSAPAWASYKQATTWQPSSQPASQSAQVTYHAGQRVRHTKFGEGIVIESRLTGGAEEVSVAFEESGLKRLIASMAPMEILDG
jgi:DNA helicase-2/ATP-dependent DNA helicase PcrA